MEYTGGKWEAVSALDMKEANEILQTLTEEEARK